jgi:hypothetical protein
MDEAQEAAKDAGAKCSEATLDGKYLFAYDGVQMRERMVRNTICSSPPMAVCSRSSRPIPRGL